MKTVKNGSAEMLAMLAGMKGKRSSAQHGIEADVSAIWRDIESRGWEAVEACSQKFDGSLPEEIPPDRIQNAWQTVSPALRTALQTARDQIYDYQRRLVASDSQWQSPNGGRVGQLVRPLARVGVYVPGGTAAYPSCVLANVVPAKAAGVKEIIVATPPTSHLKDSVLAAIHISGVDRVFALGGVQAVAALALGLGPVPRVDKLAGPGNAYVTAAKRLAFGAVGIDMLAGPSDICVIADDSGDPAQIAADLLSQAEHDALSQAVLISCSERVCRETEQAVAQQLQTLSRRDIAARSWADFGMVVHCDSLECCAALANEVAPEHLEIITENPHGLLPLIQNAGAVFLGPHTPEAVGDYLAGPSHVLPTNGTARFFSPLSAESFLKKISLIQYSREDLSACADTVIALALEEGLDGHAQSVACRLPNRKGGGGA